MEKAPLLVLAAVASWVTVLAQKDVGAVASIQTVTMLMRLENCVVAYVLYLRKLFWPADLAVIYPFNTHWCWWEFLGCLWFLGGMTILAIRSARKRPYFLMGWLWFLGTLVPMIGIVQVGSQGMADRYTYVTMTGLFVSLVWAVGDAIDGFPRLRPWLIAVPAGALMACALTTLVQASAWKTSIRLFEHAVRVTGRNPIAYATLGFAYSNQGNNPESRRYVNDSLIIAPGQARLYGFLGRLSYGDGDLDQALLNYQSALRADPNQEESHALLALVYKNRELTTLVDFKRAEAEARRTCELTHFRQRKYILFFARICLETGNEEEALAMARKALDVSVSPDEIYEARIVLKAAVDKATAKRSEHKAPKVAAEINSEPTASRKRL